MTRYRLPDALGGMELPEDTGGVLDVRSTGRGDVEGSGEAWLLRFDIPGLGRIRVQREALVEVKEPLPPEPPVGSVVLFGGEAVQRVEEGDADTESWMGVGSSARYTWAFLCQINKDHPVVRLVPDPLTEAPELPWRDGDHGLEVRREVGCGCNGQADGDRLVRLNLGSDSVALSPKVATVAGLALLRAAAQQEAQQ